jgi:uncharacterized membrane protein YqjE
MEKQKKIDEIEYKANLLTIIFIQVVMYLLIGLIILIFEDYVQKVFAVSVMCLGYLIILICIIKHTYSILQTKGKNNAQPQPVDEEVPKND